MVSGLPSKIEEKEEPKEVKMKSMHAAKPAPQLALQLRRIFAYRMLALC
jgi:hypothetical protein